MNLKIQSLITTYNINNGKMNIIDLSGCVNNVKLEGFIQFGISECGRWLYYGGGKYGFK